jgi:hypothetical protein
MRHQRQNEARRGAIPALLMAGGCLLPMLALAGDAQRDVEGPCALSAQAARRACAHEVEDDYFLMLGKCANLSDAAERDTCTRIANARRRTAPADCNEVFEARDDLCDDLGQAAYDPQIDPDDFVDPADIGGSVAPNPYYPLVPGSTWTYADDEELVRVEVTGETVEILGVTCAVVRDVASEGGVVIEDTDDWIAQDVHGNVWYFGELSQNFEDGELVDVEGSWKAGEELAKPGILFEAAPAAGDVYRQEFALGEAEDGAEVLSTTASAVTPAASCSGNCVLTEEFNLLEPDSLENKYYAPGVGLILETDPVTGERNVQLLEYRIGAR